MGTKLIDLTEFGQWVNGEFIAHPGEKLTSILISAKRYSKEHCFTVPVNHPCFKGVIDSDTRLNDIMDDHHDLYYQARDPEAYEDAVAVLQFSFALP